MKKVLLLAVVAGLVSFTSCKKETTDSVVIETENAADKTGDAIEDGADKVADVADQAFEDAKAVFTDAPMVSTPALQELVNKLHDEAVMAKAASLSGNMDKMNESVANIASLKGTLDSFKADADYAKAEAYYNEVKAELEK